MKKLITLTIIALLILLFAVWEASAYDLPRCYYQKTGMRYIPQRVYKNANNTHSCYVNVGGNVKSMGVATLEDPTGIKGFENDKVLVSTGEVLTITKVNDSIYGTGWCLMSGTLCYPLQSDYGRYLLTNGTIQ